LARPVDTPLVKRYVRRAQKIYLQTYYRTKFDRSNQSNGTSVHTDINNLTPSPMALLLGWGCSKSNLFQMGLKSIDLQIQFRPKRSALSRKQTDKNGSETLSSTFSVVEDNYRSILYGMLRMLLPWSWSWDRRHGPK